MGSLVARWLARSACCHLWLLGRSGRAGGDAPLTPEELEGPGIVTLARSDVSSAEEAAFAAHAAARTTQHRLEASKLLMIRTLMRLHALCSGRASGQAAALLSLLKI